MNLIIALLLLTGTLFILIAAIGIIRFKDLYSRMHATTKATSFGILLLLVAITLHFFTWIIALKAFLVLLFIYLTAPLAAHSVAKSFDEENTDTL